MRTFEFNTAEGRTCCATDNLENLCAHCRAAYDALVAEARQANAPPNPYSKPLAAMRAAASTPASKFEDEWKATRRRDLQAGRS